jgi:hypothetical protein
VARGSPILSIMAEMFLKFYDEKYIKHLSETKNIMLVVHDSKKIVAEVVISNMNQKDKNFTLSPIY